MKDLFRFRLDEAAALSGVEPDLILRFVSYSWIAPVQKQNEQNNEHEFDDEDIARIRLILDLQSKMGIGDEAIPVILHLVDQINCLHREIKNQAKL